MENRRLKRIIRSQEIELESLKGTSKKLPTGNSPVALFHSQAKNEHLFSKSKYTSYVLSLLRQTSIFHIYKQILHVVRRYTFIRTTVRILVILLAVIQSSAIFLLSASVFLISLPITLLISNATLILTFFLKRSINQKNKIRLQGKDVIVFFPIKRVFSSKSCFFHGLVQEITEQQNKICVIVSPYFWSARGLNNHSRRPYLASRAEGPSVLLIRKHYYFYLKRFISVEDPSFLASMTEIY